MLLAYHKVGDSFFDSIIVDMIRAFMERYPSNGVPIVVTKSYEEITNYCNNDCTKKSLKFTLNGEVLDITVVDGGLDKTVSMYSVTLAKGLIGLLSSVTDKTSVQFEFTGGIVEYRIATETPAVKEVILIAVSFLDNGIKKYLGVYDVSIPPDNR
jgi:hypothetical protein